MADCQPPCVKKKVARAQIPNRILLTFAVISITGLALTIGQSSFWILALGLSSLQNFYRLWLLPEAVGWRPCDLSEPTRRVRGV